MKYYIFILLVTSTLFSNSINNRPKIQKRIIKHSAEEQKKQELLLKYESITLLGIIKQIDHKERKILVNLEDNNSDAWLKVQDNVKVRYFGRHKNYIYVDLKYLNINDTIQFESIYLFESLVKNEISPRKEYEVTSIFLSK